MIDKEKVALRIKEGVKTYKEIADEFGMSRQYVHIIARALDVPRRDKRIKRVTEAVLAQRVAKANEYIAEGMILSKALTKAKVRNGTPGINVEASIKNRRKDFSFMRSEIEKIAEGGGSLSDLAEAIGFSRNYATTIVKNMDEALFLRLKANGTKKQGNRG